MRIDRRIVAMTLAAASLAAPAAAQAAHDAPDLSGPLAQDCTELDAIVQVPQERARRYVPSDYTMTQFWPDDPRVLTTHVDMLLRVFHCKRQTLGNRTRTNVTHALFGPAVLPTRGVATPNTPTFSFYTWFWVSDNPDFVDWARRHTRAAAEIVHVPKLRYSEQRDESGNVRYDLRVPKPSPSPFTFWTRSGPAGNPLPLRVHWWLESAGASWSVTNTIRQISTVATAEGELRPRSGSQMDRVIGDGVSRDICCRLLQDPFGEQPREETFLNATFDEQLTTAERVITP